jgi:rubredoxin
MGREPPKFRELPDDCTCLGEGPAPVSRVPRFGAMPELITYQCPACGHVETIEVQPTSPGQST